MGTRRFFLAAIAIAWTIAPALAAQWPRYPAPDIPRTADGKPDLTAPAPKTADGKPDLSGVWQYARPRPRVNVGVGGAGGTPLPDGTVPNFLLQFWDISYGMAEPLPFQPWAAELRKQRMANNNQDNPD